MESVIKTNDLEGEIKYPCLMTAHINFGAIVVLFKEQNYGTVVYSERRGQPIGHYSEAWNMSGFTPFDGTIQLTND